MDSKSPAGNVRAMLTTRMAMSTFAVFSSEAVSLLPKSVLGNCSSTIPQTNAARDISRKAERNIPLSRAMPTVSFFALRWE